MTPPTPTPTAGFENASAGVANGFADATGLGPVVVIGLYIVGTLLAAQFVAPWLARSRWLSRAGGGLLTSLVFALKGLGATAALALAAAPVFLLWQADGGTRELALRYVGYAVAGYLALVLVGWLADRAVAAFVEAHPDAEALGDLLPESEDDDPEAVADGGERA